MIKIPGKMWVMIVVLTFLFPLTGGAGNSGLGGNAGWLTPEEKAWLKAHPEIRLAPDPDFPPIEWIDERGQFQGLAADFAGLVENRLGIRFKVVKLSSWSAVIAAVKHRKVDVLSAASPSVQRREYLNFTEPHIVLPGLIFVREDQMGPVNLAELRGKKATVVSQYVWEDYLSRDYPEIRLYPGPGVAACLRMVSFGSVDAMVGDLATATYYLQKEGITNLRVAGESGYHSYLSFAVRNDWPVLAAILGKALADIDPGESKAVLDRWIRMEGHSFIGSRPFLILLAVVIGGTLLELVWNRSLQRVVRERTQELRFELAGRKEAVAALAESEEKLRQITASARDGIIMMDSRGRVSFWNRAAEKIFGYEAGEILGKDLHRVLAPEKYYSDFKNGFHRFREEGSGRLVGSNIQVSGLKKDGKEFPIEVSLSSVKMKGQWYGIGIVRDITARVQAESEKKEMEKKLQHSQKMEALGTLAGGIAHDFNNILSGIYGYSQLAEMHLKRPNEAMVDIKNIVKGASRAAELVHQILTFSRRADPEKQPLSLFIVAKEVVKLIRSTIPATIEIREVINSTAAIMADPTQMHQMIMNLCTNASHAMADSGGELTIALDEVDAKGKKYLELKVADTGHGMDAVTLEKAFEPYFTTKPREKGTGLGLALVHAIVDEHGGELSVSSVPGEGTRFSIRFPVVEKKKTPRERLPESKQLTGTESIMLVDDEESIRTFGEYILKKYGYSVMVFKDGEEAFKAFSRDPGGFDLVISDVTMPRMTGDELADKVMALRNDIPVILCTGYSEKMSKERAREKGLAGFIQKPFSASALCAVIREVLDR
ncbi:MAG: transporter substrate-binding domain-containing protein [Desulfobacter sp.]|nr:MAG: transporter substrate-binding domain-containing protein [Desulfobacter sp.]